MTMTTTITITETTSDLHHRYAGQARACPAHVELDCETGTLSASVDYDPGATPLRCWHGLATRWNVATLTADAANALLSEVGPLAQRVLDGYTREWDGQNFVGRYTDDAREAIQEIEALCTAAGDDESSVVGDVDAGDFFGPISHNPAVRAEVLGITADTDDDRIAEIVEENETVALTEMRAHLSGAEQYLRGLRDDLRDLRSAE